MEIPPAKHPQWAHQLQFTSTVCDPRKVLSIGTSITLTLSLGSSISVFGSNLLSGSRSQTTVLYTLDKEPTTSMTYDLKSGNPNSSNFNWYHLDGLPKTQHTLKMAVNSADTPFNLDYITYVPSFSSLAEQPQSPPSTPTLSLAKLLGAVIGSMGTYNVDHTSTGRNVGSPTPNQMIPLARIDTTSDEINRTPEGRSRS
ncbi:hypothetical protein C0993_008190 [Termitomyces sp. T159_Od127]|nr:hypothetical protein C0993_008190 [Termitomyces sp. T159_Od127]